jgi:hypothetical protein
MHVLLLAKDAWYTKSWKDKLRIWIMPTGWRPADVAVKFPVYKIDDVYNFEKYDPYCSGELLAWSWIQLIILLISTSYLFANIATIGSPNFFIYGLFIFLSVYAFTELMSREKSAIVWEVLKNILGCLIIFSMGGWFSSSPHVAWATRFILCWFALSTLVSAWFVFVQFSAGAKRSITIQ